MYELDEDMDALRPRRDAPGPRDQVQSGEIYLRLAEINLDDPQEILEFANTFDKLGVIESQFAWSSFHIPATGEDQLSAARAPVGRVAAAELWEEWKAGKGAFKDMSQKRFDPIWKNEGVAALTDESIETLTEFRVGAQFIRDGLKAWRFLRGDLGADEFRWESPYFKDREETGHVVIDCEDYLLMLLDFGLMPFHPGISFLESNEESGEDGDARFRVTPGSGDDRQRLDLYPILCLELFNHMVEEASYRVCANERCGRLFVRQEGRAQFDQRRKTGVKYCSALCAKAQAQREYRRRSRGY
jgi:hypothetical protein